MVWVGRDLKYHLVPRHPQLLWATRSLLPSMVLIAPYPETLQLSCLHDIFHQDPESANPADSPGTPCSAWSLPGPPAQPHRRQGDSCQGWQAEGKAQLEITRRGAELLQPAPGGGESTLSSPGATLRVFRPAWLWVPHVPCQTLTAPQRGRQPGRQQHPSTMVPGSRLAWPLRPALAALRQAAPGQRRGLSTPSGPGHTLDLGGIFPPLTTPFSPTQEVDYAQLEGNLRRYAGIPFRGECCLLPRSAQGPARPLPTPGALQPASFPRALSLRPDCAPALAAPRVTHPGHFARVCPCTPPPHSGACLHARSMRVQACTHPPRAAAGSHPTLCTPVHTHTGSAPRDVYLLVAQDGWMGGRRGAAGRGWRWWECAPGSPLF